MSLTNDRPQGTPAETVVRPPPIWRVLNWGLFGAFLVAAVLNMTDSAAGFATNHLADVSVPAWLYVGSRGLAAPQSRNRLKRILGATPEVAAAFLFIVCSITEVSQIYWPRGLFSGRFDPLDIVAFACGILPLYLLDKWYIASGRSR